VVRAVFALAPVWFVGSALLSLSAVLPRDIAVWVGLIAIDAIGMAVALSYRTPRRLVPSWLLDEISKGQTIVVAPDRGEWLLLGGVLALFTIGNVAGVLLIVGYHS
jgi:hypothetical protein